MTPAERAKELMVAMQTRLGELCGKGRPTPEQEKLARDEAERHVEACDTEGWRSGLDKQPAVSHTAAL